MIQDIMTNGYVSNKAYLGITPGTMNEQMAAQYRYDVTKGVFIYSVEEGSAADKAGLKMGDVIMKIDGTDVDSYQELVALKKKYSAGDESTFTIYRDGKQQEVSVTWGACLRIRPRTTTASPSRARTITAIPTTAPIMAAMAITVIRGISSTSTSAIRLISSRFEKFRKSRALCIAQRPAFIVLV